MDSPQFFGFCSEKDDPHCVDEKEKITYRRTGKYTVMEALKELTAFFEDQPFYKDADFVTGCEPFWLCPMVHAVNKGYLSRSSYAE